jgi:peptide/nickel transport system substrate-binding protein
MTRDDTRWSAELSSADLTAMGAVGPLTRRALLRQAGIGGSVVTLSGLLAACGGSRAGDSQTQTGAPVSGGEAKQGGTLVMPVDDLTGNFEPGIFATYADWMGVEMIARGLTHCDFRSAEVTPAIAESWTISRDRTVYTFKIRQGLKFHDGTPVTANDFERSWTRLVDAEDPSQAPGSFTAFSLLGVPIVKSWKAVDAATFRVTLDGPDESFLARCGTLAGAALSTASLERYKRGVGKNLVGCGPYRLASFTPGQQAVFEAFDGYYAGRPNLDKIIFQIVSSPTALQSALSSGSAQASNFASLTSLSALEGKLTVASGAPRQQIFCYLNATADSLKDIRVRQAVNFAIDRKRVIAEGLNGYGVQPGYIVAKGIAGYSDELIELSTQDLTRARDLVDQAGATGTTIRFLAPNNRWWPTVGQIVQENVEEVGLKADFSYVDQAAFSTAQTDLKQHEVVLDSLTAPMVDPDSTARALFTTGGLFASAITGQDSIKDVSAKLSAMLVKARQERDPAVRERLYVDIQRVAAEELMVIAMLAYNPAPVAYADSVQNINVDALGCYHGFLEDASLA